MAEKRRSRKKASSRKSKARKKSKARQGVLWPIFKWTLTASVWGLIMLGGVLAYYAYDLPDISKALVAERRATVTVKAADGATLAQLGNLYGSPVRLRDLPPALPMAIMATEDRRFYWHLGVDFIGLARAMYSNLRAGRVVQGRHLHVRGGGRHDRLDGSVPRS